MSKVYVIDRDIGKVIDILPNEVWLTFTYDAICIVYKITNMDWIKDSYDDYEAMLENYKAVL